MSDYYVTPWTVACQAPLSMGFLCPGQDMEHFLLQGIFLTQGSNPCLLHWQADSLPLSHQGSSTRFTVQMTDDWKPQESLG